MNDSTLDQSFRKDFLFFGLAVSLCWHLFWSFLIVPVLGDPFYAAVRSRCVFLGPILKDADLAPDIHFLKQDKFNIATTQKDLSRESYFNRKPVVFYKPSEGVRSRQGSPEEILPEKIKSPVSFNPVRDISFGFSDYSQYISGVDFSDLEKIVSRSDELLATFVEFRIKVSQDGKVASIKKTVSSGDPSFDLTVMLRLKKAVFSPMRIPSDRWLDVKFLIKK